jgi:hypothetical protein
MCRPTSPSITESPRASISVTPMGSCSRSIATTAPEYVAQMRANGYAEMDKLDFAIEECSLAEAMSGLMDKSCSFAAIG